MQPVTFLSLAQHSLDSFLLVQLAAALCGDDFSKRPYLLQLLEPRQQPTLHLRGRVGRLAFLLLPAVGQGGQGEGLKDIASSSSVSSVSRNSVGAVGFFL